MVEEAYQRAKEILIGSRDKLDQLAGVLFEREVIFREDVEKIYGKRPWDKEAESGEEKADDASQATSTTENQADTFEENQTAPSAEKAE